MGVNRSGVRGEWSKVRWWGALFTFLSIWALVGSEVVCRDRFPHLRATIAYIAVAYGVLYAGERSLARWAMPPLLGVAAILLVVQ